MSLVWKGLELKPAHGRWYFWIAQGRDESPAARTGSDLVPFRRGRLGYPAIHDTRVIELRGSIREATPEDLAATRDMLKASLDAEAGDGLLVDTREDGSVRWIEARPRNAIWTWGNPLVRLVSIELEAVSDPLWHADWGQWFLDSGLFLDDGWVLDEAENVVITPTGSPFDVTFTALGTARTEAVRVEVDGASTGVVGVSNVTAGHPVIGFTHPALAGGALLVVDSGTRTVTLGGVQARGNLTLLAGNEHGEYLRLWPGSNTIRVTGTPAQIRVIFDRSYL